MECSVFILYLIQDRLLLFVLEILLLDLEGLVQQLQLGGVGLEVHLRALIIGLPRKDWRGGGDEGGGDECGGDEMRGSVFSSMQSLC